MCVEAVLLVDLHKQRSIGRMVGWDDPANKPVIHHLNSRLSVLNTDRVSRRTPTSTKPTIRVSTKNKVHGLNPTKHRKKINTPLQNPTPAPSWTPPPGSGRRGARSIAIEDLEGAVAAARPPNPHGPRWATRTVAAFLKAADAIDATPRNSPGCSPASRANP